MVRNYAEGRDTVILSAGSIHYTNLPIKTNTSNSMVPVNGKPVISWILDDLIAEEGDGRVILVVREDDDLIQEFLDRVYKTRLNLKVVTLSHSKSILHSLRAGLRSVQSKSVRLILGDTLVQDTSVDHEHDFIYVQEVDDSSRWCLALLDDRSQAQLYIDKQPNVPPPHYALCGYYVFGDSHFLFHQLEEVLRIDKRQISDLLLQYQIKYPLTAHFATRWFDFGNPDNFIHAKQRLLQGRFFNSLTIDPVLNTITKVSDLDQKLRNELNWYEQLPDKLKVLTPRIVSKEERDGKLYLTQEYYGYPTLSELLLFSNLSVESWESIFRTLLKIHSRFKEYSGKLEESEVREIYYTKTFERIGKMQETGKEWGTLFSAPVLKINNKMYSGLPYYMEALKLKIQGLIGSTTPAIVHGDYCFSNILYDITSHIVRLIDPRGNFGRDGIYGDPRYDIAKLRHSVCGKYDYLIADLFSLEEEEASFIFEVYARADSVTIEQKFDGLVGSQYNLKEIKLIEALLFLSMIPYHQDKPKRQKAMFLTGIMRLSEIDSENSN
jgi:dTDP-glucose pyrophosphorylase